MKEQMIEDIGLRRKDEGRFLKVVQNMPVMMDAFDAQWNIVMWNRECERVTGYGADDIIGNPRAMEMLYPDMVYRESMMREWKRRGDDYRDWEWKITCRDGTVKTISWSNISRNLPIQGWATWGIGVDVTERKKLEEALRFQGEVVSNMAEGVALVRASDSIIVYANRRFEEMFGYRPGEVVGRDVVVLAGPKASEAAGEIYQQIVAALDKDNRWTGEVKNIKKDGIRFWTHVSISTLETSQYGTVWVGVHEDITERKRAEELLQEQKNALEQKNIALSEVLGQLEIEKKQLKDNVIANVDHLIVPLVEKLRMTGVSRKYVKLLRNNLQELASSFGRRLTEQNARLSPREVEICNMIKNGLTSKEIANLLHSALPTIERHRHNIRRKLGIVNRDFNLTSYLQNL